ncbi:MerR family transcriptional regulator [Streptomyces sp. NBC_00847]|uniref:MerR family transcriptional regulator n=1 Tax=unclassified Streptomyces TaxID=2593676 RepID=UPI00224F7E8F|nr:MerR family transcriptional regulator [Streptomyces sp. NBC_00847]MCX4878160.1 MerR family transcriptional regulator [Streptomyces sp. NBC_00847]
MAWSTAEVARMSGVTSRTLRHYDEVGLLPPAWVGSNGYRYYEERELLRLQQILVMRELGLGLVEIGVVLAEQVDQVEALRVHHRRLVAERDRLDTPARTVSRTIAALQDRKDHDMSTMEHENLFEGFDTSRYQDPASKQWPQEAEQSQQFADTLTAQDHERLPQEATALLVRLATLMAAGTPVADPAVQAEVDTQYQSLSRMWTPNGAAFKALGQAYVTDPQWRSVYDQVADGLAEYQRDAMAAYADASLS